MNETEIHKNGTNDPPPSAAEIAQIYEAASDPGEPVPEPRAPEPRAPEPQSAPEPPATPAIDHLRLRMKVWTDTATSKRYLMPAAFMRDVVNGKPVSDVMYAYALRDDDTKLVTLTAREWNALPYFYFHEDGPAPRASGHPGNVI